MRPWIERLQRSPIAYRLARGTFWSLAGAVISRGLMLAASVVVARILGKGGFGELGIIRSTVGMFGVLAGFGLGLTSTKHIAEFRDEEPERAGRIIGLSNLVAMLTGGGMAVALVISAPWLAAHSLNAPHLANILRVGSLILFINALNGAQTGALAGFEAFKEIAHVNLYAGLISFPLMVGGACLGGVTGAVWALAANLGINWLLNHVALRREARRHGVAISWERSHGERHILWKFSLPAALSGILVGPVKWICNALLVNQDDGYAALGVLTATLAFQQLLVFASGMLNAPLLSMISNAGKKISRRLATVNILSSGILGVAVSLPILWFPETAEVLFGKEFSGRSFRYALAFGMLSTCIMLYKQGVTRLLVARSYMWWGFLSNLIWALGVLGSAVYCVRFGAWGIALAFYVGYVVNIVVYVPMAIRFRLVTREQLVSWPVLSVAVFLHVCAVLPVLVPSLLERFFLFCGMVLVVILAVWVRVRQMRAVQ